MTATQTDVLTIAGKTMSSRLLLGPGGLSSLEVMGEALEASGDGLRLADVLGDFPVALLEQIDREEG
jgi:hypothetical protein